MPAAIDIRPARPADAEVASVLLYSAYVHAPVSYPLPQDTEGGWVGRLRDSFRREGNRFSYQYTQVAVESEAVVGLVLSFGGRDEPRLNAAVGGWLERNAEDDDWYVDALAVLERWQRHGIGTQLVRGAERQACQQQYRRVAGHVAEGNRRALDLYTHLGYVVTGHAVLYQRPHVRMVKTLDCGTESSERTTQTGRRA